MLLCLWFCDLYGEGVVVGFGIIFVGICGGGCLCLSGWLFGVDAATFFGSIVRRGFGVVCI